MQTKSKVKVKKIDRVIKLPERPIPQITIKSKPYKALLLYILDVIKLNPDHHNQQHWRCNSSFCFAGFTDLVVAVYFKEKVNLRNVQYSPEDESPLTTTESLLKRVFKKEFLNNSIGWDVKDVNVEYIAKHTLGLSDLEADCLFRDSQTLYDVEKAIREIIAGDLR